MRQQQGVGINNHVEAARNVSLGIENAMVAYDYPGILNLATNQAKAPVPMQLAELSKIVTTLKEKKEQEFLTLYQRVQCFILSLDLHSWEPRLAGTLHSHVYVKKNCFEVFFNGMFKNAVAYNEARLIVGKSEFKPKQAADDRLNFSVTIPSNYLSEKAHNQYCVIKASLEVGYNHGALITYPRKAQYEVYIGLYPLNAAQATVNSTTKVPIENKKQKTRSPMFTISGENKTSNTLSYCATPGWTISGTPSLVINDVSEEISKEKYTESRVDLQLSVNSGNKEIRAFVEFEESHPAFEDKLSTHEVSLKWDEPFEFEAETFKIHIKSLEGAEVELTEIKKAEGCFRVTSSNGKYQLIAIPPEPKS